MLTRITYFVNLEHYPIPAIFSHSRMIKDIIMRENIPGTHKENCCSLSVPYDLLFSKTIDWNLIETMLPEMPALSRVWADIQGGIMRNCFFPILNQPRHAAIYSVEYISKRKPRWTAAKSP
jgi:hypothetical protein